ncbi:MAG: NnrU family protein [Desulfobacterales bacterium]|nr:NnrU family protein [Desulfobacterales bacterium]
MNALTEYILLAVIWGVYCAVHSLTISPPFLRWVRNRFPKGHRFHRLAFNLFSILTLIPVVWYSWTLSSAPIFQWEGSLRGLQAAFIVIGVALLAAGALHYDFREFMGFSQISTTDACRSIGKDCELKTSGILGLVRHPWYTAVFFLLWARDLDPAAVIVNSVLTVYVIIGTHLEERKLIAVFGQTYQEYQKEVSMFFPIKWLLSKSKHL